MGEENILEQQCMEIMHNTTYPSLSDGEKERLLVLVAHDLAMGAKENRSRWVNDLLTLDSALLNEQGAYSMLGKNTRTDSFDLAVRHNSMAITASIREDFVAGTHPGAIIFPLLMAETERSSKSAEEFLTAAVIGLKLAILLNSVFGKALAQKGYRATTVVGAMAGAASLSMLRGYSLSEAMKAMSVAASTGLGFAFSFLDGAEEWIVQASMASQLANLACLNAKSLHFAQDKFLTGERSLSHLLECEVCRNPQTVDLSLVNIGVKRHPVNSFVQPVVEAVLRLPQVNVSDIDSIVVSVPESFASMSMLSLTGPYPRPNLALLSIPSSVALALSNQGIQFDDLRKANQPDVLELAQKVEINYSPELSSYDVRVLLIGNGQEWDSSVATSFFYPSLEQELEWIRNEWPQPLPWLEELLRTAAR